MKPMQTLSERPAYLADSLQKQGILGRWYHIMAYHLPEGQKPTSRDQEIIRRSRLATFVLVVQLLLIEAPVVPVVAAAPNHAIVMPWLLGCIVMLLLAFVCNRLGKLTLAGLFMVLSIEVTVCLKILTVPGGISLATMSQFDILIQPVLLAVVLLPPWTSFVVAGFNIAFILFCLFARPLAPDLVAALKNPALAGDLLAVPVMAEVIISTIAFLIVANLLSALKRASKAEQIAALEHAIAHSRAEIERRNQDLEQGIAGIVRTIQSATGSQTTYEKVTLPPGNVLWPVIQQIWVFLDRYQRARQAESAYEATVQASTELLHCLEEVQQGRSAQLPPRRGTPLDSIIFTLGQLQRQQQQRQEGHFSGPLTRPSNP